VYAKRRGEGWCDGIKIGEIEFLILFRIVSKISAIG